MRSCSSAHKIPKCRKRTLASIVGAVRWVTSTTLIERCLRNRIGSFRSCLGFNYPDVLTSVHGTDYVVRGVEVPKAFFQKQCQLR
jgi:hypothetical protein